MTIGCLIINKLVQLNLLPSKICDLHVHESVDGIGRKLNKISLIPSNGMHRCCFFFTSSMHTIDYYDRSKDYAGKKFDYYTYVKMMEEDWKEITSICAKLGPRPKNSLAFLGPVVVVQALVEAMDTLKSRESNIEDRKSFDELTKSLHSLSFTGS